MCLIYLFNVSPETTCFSLCNNFDTLGFSHLFDCSVRNLYKHICCKYESCVLMCIYVQMYVQCGAIAAPQRMWVTVKEGALLSLQCKLSCLDVCDEPLKASDGATASNAKSLLDSFSCQWIWCTSHMETSLWQLIMQFSEHLIFSTHRSAFFSVCTNLHHLHVVVFKMFSHCGDAVPTWVRKHFVPKFYNN